MLLDYLLLVVVVGGIGLSGAYLGAEYLRWRRRGAAERQRALALSELHAARLVDRPKRILPSVLRFKSHRTASQPQTIEVAERRKRDRTAAR